MARIDGGEMLVRVLERAGIRTVFTLHGGHLDAILQAAHDRGLHLVDTRHEQAAGHAADGWARTTGKPGVAIVTAGPGFTDCITAIANAGPPRCARPRRCPSRAASTRWPWSRPSRSGRTA
jgi:acetolactate synthase-1/2/3 large subunit